MAKTKDAKAPQRREAVRINVPRTDIQLWATREGMSVAEQAKLVNLSATGALIQTRHSYSAGSHVRCVFWLSGGGYFSLSAHVVRCSVKENMTDRYMVAVHYKAPVQSEEALVRWIFRWMAHQHRLAR